MLAIPYVFRRLPFVVFVFSSLFTDGKRFFLNINGFSACNKSVVGWLSIFNVFPLLPW